MAEIVFLGIKGLFDKAALRSQDDEARARRGSENAGTKDCAQAIGIVESDIEGIVRDGVLTLNSNVGRHSFRQPEEYQRVVDEMRCNIEEDAAARPLRFPPGARFQLRTISVVMCFETHYATKRAVRHELSNGLKIAVEPTVLIYSEQAAHTFCKLYQRAGLLESGCEGLVDNYVAPCRKALACKGIMRVVGSSDNDEPNFFHRQQFVQIAHDSNVRIFFPRLVAGSLQDGSKVQARHGANHGRVKRATGEPKSYESYFNHSALLPSPLRRLRRRCTKCLAPAKCHDVLENANLGKSLAFFSERDFLAALRWFRRQWNCDLLHWTNPSRLYGQMGIGRQPCRAFLARAILRIVRRRVGFERFGLCEGIQTCNHTGPCDAGARLCSAQCADVCARPCGQRHLWPWLRIRHAGNEFMGRRNVWRAPRLCFEHYEFGLGRRRNFFLAARHAGDAHVARHAASLCRRGNLRCAGACAFADVL